MATLTYTASSHLGVALPFAAASVGGDLIAPALNGLLLVRNSDATATVVTVVVPGNTYGQARPDYTFSVDAGVTASIGPLPRDLINADGLVALTYSKVVSLTVAGVSI
jgi:hypothetical protein